MVVTSKFDEGDVQAVADAVGSAEGFDDQHDLPYERQAGARRACEKRRELRQRDVAQRLRGAELVDGRHLGEIARQSCGRPPAS